MPLEKIKKIVYLFGAGATHAELTRLDENLNPERRGLRIGDVSSRVIEIARKDKEYLKDVATVSATGGSLNIELLISLIENSKISGWAHKTSRLKELVEKDIKSILTASQMGRFNLHKALFEFHEHRKAKTKQQLIGIISLNYDDVVDRAYTATFREKPNYCLSLEADVSSSETIPLLKLHGSFNWESQKIRGRKRKIEIIPLGASKNYLHPPYGFIWNRALEILIECDTLRVIGCSLSPNDSHLIDLLFKAHLERSKAFDIEIIDFDHVGDEIEDNYGFFPKIRTWKEIVPDLKTLNPFRTWLKYESSAILGDGDIRKTRYLKKV